MSNDYEYNLVSYFNGNTKPIDLYNKYISKIKYNLNFFCKNSNLNDIDSELIVNSIINLSIHYIQDENNFIESRHNNILSLRGCGVVNKIRNLDELDSILELIWTINIVSYIIIMKYCIDIDSTENNKIYIPYYKNTIQFKNINKLELKILKFIDFRIYKYILKGAYQD